MWTRRLRLSSTSLARGEEWSTALLQAASAAAATALPSAAASEKRGRGIRSALQSPRGSRVGPEMLSPGVEEPLSVRAASSQQRPSGCCRGVVAATGCNSRSTPQSGIVESNHGAGLMRPRREPSHPRWRPDGCRSSATPKRLVRPSRMAAAIARLRRRVPHQLLSKSRRR
jgi:hypothetical protein